MTDSTALTCYLNFSGLSTSLNGFPPKHPLGESESLLFLILVYRALCLIFLFQGFFFAIDFPHSKCSSHSSCVNVGGDIPI